MADKKNSKAKVGKEKDELTEELREEAEELKEEVAEEPEEASEEVTAEDEKPEEDAAEEAEDEKSEEDEAEEAEDDRPAMKVSTANKREKKKTDREAKAARKAANAVEQKKSRPNNGVLAVMIFGVLIAMFAFVQLYNYFSKPASIEAYLDQNAELYADTMIDYYTTAALTAEGNSLKVDMSSVVEDAELADMISGYYEEDEDDENLKYVGAYFLTDIKPQVRGGSADVTVTMSVNGVEIKSVSMTYKEAEEFLESLEEEAEDESGEAEEGEAEDSDDAADEAEDDGE